MLVRRSAIVVCTAAVVLLLAPFLYHATTFHYLEVVENDPLVAPVRVVSVREDLVELEDGRVFQLQGVHWLGELAAGSELQIDLEPADAARATVFVKRRQTICGTPWARPISIPIIADKVPAYTREFAGYANLRKAAQGSRKKR